LRLPADPQVVADARRHAVALCRDTLDEQQCDDLALAVSELVTNAIRHGGDPVTLTVLPREGTVRVEVTDGGAALLTPPEPGELSTGRRGLRLVAAVCRAWGWHAVDDGKCVWCEL